MKIALVAPTPLFPTNAGNRARALAMIRALRSLGHEVHYIQLDIWDWEQGDAAAGRAELGADRFHVLSGRVPALDQAMLRAWRAATTRLRLPLAHCYTLDGWFDRALLPALATIDARQAFDAVIVEYVFLSRAFGAFAPRAARILDTHDVFAERWKMLRRAGIRPYWYATTRRAEARGLDRADVVLAIQDAEAADLRARTAQPVMTVSHIPARDDRPLHHRPAAALLASSNHLNAASLDWFVQQVLPLVLAKRPHFQLFLAGSISMRAPVHQAVVPLGFVDDLRTLFERAPIAINPLQAGSGINIKLLDALASGAPVVTTETGARGLKPATSCAIVRDGDAHGFAAALLALLDSPARWAEQHAAARATAKAWRAQQIGALTSALDLAQTAARQRCAAR